MALPLVMEVRLILILDRIVKGGGPIVLTVFQLVTLSAPQAPLPGVVTTYYCSVTIAPPRLALIITSSLRR